jgi:GT2 family glycosyltransferase
LQAYLTAHKVRQINYEFPFNWAAVNNLAAQSAKGDHLLFLNDDMEVITPDWLQALLEQSQRPEIGAVGGKLLFADGRIQHVGVALQNQTPGHPFYGADPDNMGYRSSNHIIRNCLAVTGACLMTPARLFHDLGGFDTSFKLNYNDVDYCLKVIASGLRVVFTPYAQLYHLESMTKSKYFSEELTALQSKWSTQFPRDPFMNPNFSPDHWDYRLGM